MGGGSGDSLQWVFSLKPLVRVNEGCAQNSEADYITASLISGVSARATFRSGSFCNWMCFIKVRNVLGPVYMLARCARALLRPIG